MRTIDKKTAECFWAGQKMSMDNTEVLVKGDAVELLLHGSTIARRRGERLEISANGFGSLTTKARLNAILGKFRSRVSQAAYKWTVLAWTPDGWKQIPMSVERGDWTLIYPGSHLEQLAQVYQS